LAVDCTCAKAVEAETIRKTVTIAIFSGVNIAISPWGWVICMTTDSEKLVPRPALAM
jgi:hypothetical protein